jgi:hypothetical protein
MRSGSWPCGQIEEFENPKLNFATPFRDVECSRASQIASRCQKYYSQWRLLWTDFGRTCSILQTVSNNDTFPVYTSYRPNSSYLYSWATRKLKVTVIQNGGWPCDLIEDYRFPKLNFATPFHATDCLLVSYIALRCQSEYQLGKTLVNRICRECAQHHRPDLISNEKPWRFPTGYRRAISIAERLGKAKSPLRGLAVDPSAESRSSRNPKLKFTRRFARWHTQEYTPKTSGNKWYGSWRRLSWTESGQDGIY